MPRHTKAVARVAMIEGIPMRATSTPLMKPTSAPTPSAATTPSQQSCACSALISSGVRPSANQFSQNTLSKR